jgi:AcrR family transcriptional regulator
MTDSKPIEDRTHPHDDPAPDAAEPVDPRRRRHDAKLAAIVAEAWNLARRDGLTGISLRELAEAVDLRQPSLYAYFDSKLALYDAMYADGFRQLLEVAAASPPSDDPRDALVEFVELCIRFSSADVVRHQLMFERMVPGFKPSPESRQLLFQFRAIAAERLGAVGIGVGDGTLGDIFTGIVAGFTQQQVISDPGGDRWLRLARPAMEMFLADLDARAKPKKVTPRRTPRPPTTPTNEVSP